MAKKEIISSKKFCIHVSFAFLIVISANLAFSNVQITQVSSSKIFEKENLPSPRVSNLKNLTESADPLELGQTEVISVEVNEPQGVLQVFITFESSNHTMIYVSETDRWIYDNWTPSTTGIYLYTISEENSKHKWTTINDSIRVVDDATPPTYVILDQKNKKIEFGKELTISINVSDSSGIKLVLVEFEGQNRSMNNTGGGIWQYSWTPCCSGTYLYTIFIEDNYENQNKVILEIEVIPPSSLGDDDDDDSEDTSGDKANENMVSLAIPFVIIAIGTAFGVVSIKKVRSRGKSDRALKSEELKNKSRTKIDIPKGTERTNDTFEKKSQINETLPVLKCDISIICPICNVSKKICVPKSIINESKQLSTISIPKKLVCDHHFQAFVDKNFVVRGYQKVDFEIDAKLAADFRICEEFKNNV